MLRIQQEVRHLQYYQYLIAQGANRSAIMMRIQKSVSIVHTEVTKTTAIQIQYVRKFPNLDWIGRALHGASFVSLRRLVGVRMARFIGGHSGL